MNHRTWIHILAALVTGILAGCAAAAMHDGRTPTHRPRNDLCPAPYIESGAWSMGTYGPILTVRTTLCGRLQDKPSFDLVFVELTKRFSGNPFWSNAQGLRDQVLCHLDSQPVSFTVEPSLPYVGLSKTVAAGCKPKVADPDPPPKTVIARPTSGKVAGSPSPTDCPGPFVQKGEWTVDEYGPILHITPTACGRRAKESDPTNVELFDAEVMARFSGNPLWDTWQNTRGLLDQLECHIRNAPTKDTYNIEPSRPYIGRDATEKALCNPAVYDPDPPPKK